MKLIALAGLLLLASPAGAQTLQQEFDAAQLLLDKGDARGAAAAFRGVLRRMPNAAADPKNRTVAIIRSGLGQALLLMGDTRGAMTAFEQALPALPDQTVDDRQAKASVLQYVGRIHELNIDYPKARESLQRSLAMNAFAAEHKTTLITQLTLARVALFDDPALALRTLGEAMPGLKDELGGGAKGQKRDILGEAYALQGRIHLNRGELREAREWYFRALSLAGGLTRKLSVADTRIRSDLAIVHHLLGEAEEVPRFLAYTGAGRGEAEDIGYGADTPLPACGPMTGIRPDDMAIIEFGIGSDGRVVGVQPIYATRRDVAAEFARAVSGWSWQPEVAVKLDPFWRAAVRIELRCSNAGATPGLQAALQPRIWDWLKSRGGGVKRAPADAEALPILRRELASRLAAHGENSVEVLGLLMELSQNALIAPKERLGYLQRASAIAATVGAPPSVQVYIDVEVAKWAVAQVTPDGWASRARPALMALIEKLDAAGPASAMAAAFVRMELAETFEASGHSSADAIYRQVIGQPENVLPAGHPFRQAALLRLASSAAAQRRGAEATALAQSTGLTPEQCALVDVRPLRTGGRISSGDFPNEALRWGFNGFIEVSYDINVDGRPINPRTVMAYPPFIFSEATEKAIRKLRFQPFANVGNKVGCADRLQRVRYSTPRI